MGNKASNAKAERDLRRGVQFVGEQLQHPAVMTFTRDIAKGLAASNGDPEQAAMFVGQRSGEELNRVINRTIDHHTGHVTPGDKSMPPLLNALTFV
jgi:hypothetical protein